MYYYYVLGKMLPVTVASVVSVVVGVALRFVEVLVTYGRHRALDLQMHDKGQGKRGGGGVEMSVKTPVWRQATQKRTISRGLGPAPPPVSRASCASYRSLSRRRYVPTPRSPVMKFWTGRSSADVETAIVRVAGFFELTVDDFFLGPSSDCTHSQ
jgi:hypothetical protein